jgi:hypothetical protein
LSWHTLSFEDVAVVSDVHWINDSVNLFKFIIPVNEEAVARAEYLVKSALLGFIVIELGVKR